jgi:hypothetical protein
MLGNFKTFQLIKPRPNYQATIGSYSFVTTPRCVATALTRQHIITSSVFMGSSIDIATGYELDLQSSIPGRSKMYLFSARSTQILGAHPASYPMGTGGKEART